MFKLLIKQLAARLLYSSGMLWILMRVRLRGRAVVLMYHRVLPEPLFSETFSHPGIIVTPDTFARHLEVLRRYFHPLTLEEFQECIELGHPFPRGACLITFDDGWIDNHEHALPLLRERGIPAVVFTATSLSILRSVFGKNI